ncbi:MAG: ATP-binding protein, partial [Candidatus Odinarchaeota archaeon]|nr:ATP-binding protein [Candidatus Odinarchaeota archaeon]
MKSINMINKHNCVRHDISKIFTLDVFQKEEEIFQRTHVYMDNLYSELNQKQVTEDDIAYSILESAKKDTHAIILIYGEAGTGKSELCRSIALKLRIEDKENKLDVIHIPKSKLILFGYLIVFDPSLLTIETLEEAINEWKRRKKVVKEFFTASLKVMEAKASPHKIEHIVDKVVERRLELLDELSKSGSSEELREKVLNFFEREDFESVGIQLSNEDDVKKLNMNLLSSYQLLRGKKGVKPLSEWLIQELTRIRKEGRYPVFIIDDATLLSENLYKELFDTISDLSRLPPSAIVIGVTTGRFLEIKNIGTISQRAKMIVNVPTIFLENKEKFIELVEKNLAALKEHNYCLSCKKQICRLLEKDFRKAYKLFPLSSKFVENWHSFLLKIKNFEGPSSNVLTPRNVINQLRSFVSLWFDKGLSPAHTFFNEVSEYIDKNVIIDPATQYKITQNDQKIMKAAIRTITMYGEKDDQGNLTIDEKIFREVFLFQPEILGELFKIENRKIKLYREEPTLAPPRQPEEVKKKESIDNLKSRIRQSVARWVRGESLEIQYMDDITNGLKYVLEEIKLNVPFNLKTEVFQLSRDLNPTSEPKIFVSTQTPSFSKTAIIVDEEDLVDLAIMGMSKEELLKYDIYGGVDVELFKLDLRRKFLENHPEIIDILENYHKELLSFVDKIYDLKNLSIFVVCAMLATYCLRHKRPLPNNRSEIKTLLVAAFEEKDSNILKDLFKALFLAHESVSRPFLDSILRELRKDVLTEIYEYKPKISDERMLKLVKFKNKTIFDIINEAQQYIKKISDEFLQKFNEYVEELCNIDMGLLTFVTKNFEKIKNNIIGTQSMEIENIDRDLKKQLLTVYGII